MSTTPIVTKPSATCKHLNTKRPFNDHTLVCSDCGKDLTDTQKTGGVAPVVAAPKISSLSPSTGAEGQIAVNGSGFGANNDEGKSTVTVGGVAVAASVWSDNKITIDLPPHAAGKADVVVKVKGQPSNAVAFVYTA